MQPIAAMPERLSLGSEPAVRRRGTQIPTLYTHATLLANPRSPSKTKNGWRSPAPPTHPKPAPPRPEAMAFTLH